LEKISAVLIAKNEQKLIGRCIKSLAGFDEIVVLDTGSTDKTVETARSLGAVVKTSEPVSPFHFANARNAAHDLAANDWILAIDADEILRAGMLRRIRAAVDDQVEKDAFEKVSAFSITFTDRSAVTHKKKIYRKSVWAWKHRVHEELVPLGTDAKEAMLESVVMEHLPSPDKTVRHGQNVELLKITVQEEPEYTRAWKYLGQELMLTKAYQDAIPYLAHYVEKTQDGALERSEGMMRLAQCYGEIKMLKEACQWFDFAASADPRRREPLYHGGWYMMANAKTLEDIMTAADFLRRCLTIPVSSRPGSHLDHPNVWGNEPAKMLACCQQEISKATPS
jgi:glycosyltransferase involved in cell wall biosynthesis